MEELRRRKREAEADAQRRVGRAASAQKSPAIPHKAAGGLQAQGQREKCRQILAYLLAEHRQILSGLVGGMKELLISSGPVPNLEERGFLFYE